MDFSFEKRISWLKSDHFSYGKQVIVIEKEEEGLAQVEVISHNGNDLCLVKTTQKNRLQYLKCQKVADGTLCEILDNQTTRLHLIECKKTISLSSWIKAINQFEGGLLNLFAVCGVLGLTKVVDVTVYTAYQNNKLDPDKITDPVLLKNKSGSSDPTVYQQWLDNSVLMQGEFFTHIPIMLDQSGNGKVSV